MRKFLTFAALFGAFASAAPAAAADYTFTLTESRTYSWVLPADPEPTASISTPPFVFFGMGGVPIDTGAGSPTPTDIFFLADQGHGEGGISFSGALSSLSGTGAQLFTGTVFDPSFVTGTFDLAHALPGGPPSTLSLTIAAADASDYAFTLTELLAYSWVLPAEPEPDATFSSPPLVFFGMDDVPVSAGGGSPTSSDIFFLADQGHGQGGISFSGALAGLSGTGAQLFTGTIFDPSFVTGTFDLTPTLPGASASRLSLTISGPETEPGGGTEPDAVPEPASWAMMVAGFGLAGAALRRRERRLASGAL